jgi:putative flippase GtrA
VLRPWEVMTAYVRMSMMKASITKDGNFRVSWLSRSLGHQHLRSSTIYIMSSMIATFITDFRWIWLSISGHSHASSSHLISIFCFIVNYVVYLVSILLVNYVIYLDVHYLN